MLLSSYLESTSSSSSSDKSLVTLYSSSDTVTWGSMAPYRTSEIAIRLKEINTETAAFTLSYTIESSAGDINTFYNVNEYYRLRWTDSKVYLLDFERRMAENIGLADITVSFRSTQAWYRRRFRYRLCLLWNRPAAVYLGNRRSAAVAL